MTVSILEQLELSGEGQERVGIVTALLLVVTSESLRLQKIRSVNENKNKYEHTSKRKAGEGERKEIREDGSLQ